jgi:hypothetical protein
LPTPDSSGFLQVDEACFNASVKIGLGSLAVL